MSGILTKKHAINNANNFVESVKEGNSSYYFFVAKHTSWSNGSDTPVPDANDSFNSTDLNIHNELVYGKRISSSDIVLTIPRYNWTSNTVYAKYDPTDGDLYTKEFFVFTSENKVYKCLDNNNDGVSTIEPSLTPTNTSFQTTDGYIWKYMYTISSPDLDKFATTNYIPLVPNTDVIAGAVPGSIDVIELNNPGQGYGIFANNSGLIVEIVNNSTITLTSNLSNINDIYNQSSIFLKSGRGGNQIRQIIDYDGVTKNVTVDPPLLIKQSLRISNIVSNFSIGDTISQKTSNLVATYSEGIFTAGSNVVQTDTGAFGTVVNILGTLLIVDRKSSNNFSNTLVIYTSGATPSNSQGTGITVAGNTTITGNSATFSNSIVGSLISVSNTYFRRVASFTNTTVIDVDYPLPVSNTVAVINIVTGNSSVGIGTVTADNYTASGNVVTINLNAKELQITGNVFTLGETIETTSGALVTGIVSFSNSTILNLINLTNGNNFTVNQGIVGRSSGKTANIILITADDNLTTDVTSTTFFESGPVPIRNEGSTSAGISVAYTIPNEQTEFLITPTISISGDGSNATAYAIVNSISNSVHSVHMIDVGSNYTFANITITANIVGNSATATPLISPVGGHGNNMMIELGANYVTITANVQNTSSENYFFPGTNSYRRFGLIKNPLYKEVYLDVSNNTISNTYAGNLVISLETKGFGYLELANSTIIKLSNVSGVFSTNNYVYVSGNLAVNGFVSNTANSIKYSLSGSNTEAYQFDMTRFNQIFRLVLTSNTPIFMQNDTIRQAVTNATGTVLSSNTDYDFELNIVTNGPFIKGDVITQSGGANAVVLDANSTYLRLTQVTGTINASANVVSGIKTANIANIHSVLLLTNIYGTFDNQNNRLIRSTNSLFTNTAVALNVNFIDTMIVKQTGDVLYIDNMAPISKNSVSNQAFTAVIRF